MRNVRSLLAQLENPRLTERASAFALEAFYRHAHPLKGISSMVGLQADEQLAHAAEGLLRDLSRNRVTLTGENLDLLAHTTQRLEQIVTAHRLGQTLPDPADLIAQPSRFDHPPSPSAPPLQQAIAVDTTPARSSALPAGLDDSETTTSESSDPARLKLLRWHASFSPSAALDARGVNINTVRARLAAFGEITSANPSIQPGGKMTFEFTLSLREPPLDLVAGEADGIVLRASESASPFPTPELSADRVNLDPPSSMFIAPSHIVRVDLSKLDELMRIVGERVIHRSRLDERIARSSGDRSDLQEVNLALGRSLREIREAITRVRLVPVAEIVARLLRRSR